MRSEQLERLFEKNGFTKVPSNLPEFTFYFRRESQGAVVIHVIDYRQGLYISEEQYAHLKRKITEFMQARGEQEVHLLTLVLSGEIQKARQLGAGDSFRWIVDTGNDRLIIHEDRVGDFYGWKGILEEFLMRPEDVVYVEDAVHMEAAGDSGAGGGDAGSRTACGAEDGESYRHGGQVSQNAGSGRARAGTGGRMRLQNLHWVTISLIVVNVIVFLICTFTGRMLYNKGALGVMSIVEDGSYYRLITSMFLHVDTGHLFNNMIILYFVGEIVEKRMGHLPYAILYFLSGIAGGVLSMGYELLSGNYTSSVGASGAVFGVEGALLLLVLLHHGRLESVTLGKLVFVIVFSLYCGFTSTDVNNAAHIGGVLMGFALAACFRMLRPYFKAGKDGDFDEN